MEKSHPRASSSTRAVCLSAALYVAVGGLVSFLGWVWGFPRLTDWAATGIAMKVNTALCCALAGTSLLLLTLWPRLRFPARTLGTLIALVGALTLFEHASGLNLGFDNALIPEPSGAPATTSPGRMGLPASISLVLVGAALALLPGAALARRRASALGLTVLAIASLPLVGYLYGASALYGFARLTGIAMQTATFFAALGVGLMAAAPEHGIVGALNRADPGAAMLRRLLLPFIAVAVGVGWLRMAGQQAGLYDLGFGTAIRTVIEIVLFMALLWWAAEGIGTQARAMQRSEERFRSLVSVITDVPWVADASGGFAVPQPAWEAYTGQGWEQHRAHGWLEALHPDDRVALEDAFRQARRSRSPLRTTGRLWHAELAEWRHFTLHAVPLLEADGSVREWVGACTDVEEEKQAETALRQSGESERAARMEAEAASRLKDQFLATLSHELRAPLNAILGWLHLLKKEDVGRETAAAGLEVIERNARAQTKLIADLLDMSRIVSGKLRLDLQPVDLLAVVRAAVEAALPSAVAKGIALETLLPDAFPPLTGDPARLQQVVSNLLSNAVKFTPEGGRVEVLLHAGQQAEIRVRDSGKGIRADFLPHVFDRFRQEDASPSRAHGGLGLGLSIVKQLVEQHGGTVLVESAGEGAGAAFTVRLPLSPGAPHEALAVPVAASGEIPRLEGLRLLVVDDEQDSRDVLSRLLQAGGARVITAESAAAGLRAIREHHPDLLLSDLAMPDGDGYGFLQEVRSKGYDLPAIAVSAFARREDRERAFRAGYRAHVTKPVEPHELFHAVMALTRDLRGSHGPQDPGHVRG